MAIKIFVNNEWKTLRGVFVNGGWRTPRGVFAGGAWRPADGRPAAPSQPYAVAVGATSITIGWTDNSTDEAGFKVGYGSPGTANAVLGAGATSFTRSNLQPGTAYRFYVCAYNAQGESAWAGPLDVATTGAPPEPLNAPTDVSAAAVDSHRVEVSWLHDRSDGGGVLLGYRIWRMDGGSGPVQVADPNANRGFVDGLQPGTPYRFTVTAYDNGGGESPPSDPSPEVTTPAGDPPWGVPSNVSASSTIAGTADVAWGFSGSGHSGFRIYEWGGSGWAQVGSAGGDGARSGQASGLTPGTTHELYVAAYNAYGEGGRGGPSNPVTIAGSGGATVPAAPTNLGGSWIGSSADLYWSDLSSNEDGFRVYRDGSLVGTSTLASYLDPGPAGGFVDGRWYSWRVTAYTAAGESGLSNTLDLQYHAGGGI